MDGASVNEDAVTETFEVVSSGPSRFGLVAAALLLCIVFGAGAVLQSGNANGDEQELVAPVVTSTSSILTATLPPHTLKPGPK